MRIRTIPKTFLALAIPLALIGCGETKQEPAASTPAAKRDPLGQKPAGPQTTGVAKPADQAPTPREATAPTASIAAPPWKMGKTLDPAYAGPGFFGALVVHPARIAQSPLVAPLLKDPNAVAVMEELGLQPADVEQIVLLAPVPTKEKPPGAAESPTFVVRFARPVDAKSLLTKFQAMVMPGPKGELTQTKLDGKSCYQFVAAPWVLAYVPDAKTIVLGTDRDMKKALAAGEAKGPLADRLRHTSADSDLVVTMAFEPVREMAKQGIAEAKRGLPPPLAPFADLPTLLRGATVALNLSGDTLLEAALDALDATSAERVEALARQALELGKAQVAQLQQAVPPAVRPSLGPALKLADQAVDGIGVGKTAQRVVVALKRPAALDEALSQLVAMAQRSVRGARQDAKQIMQMNNLKQVAVAMFMYEQERHAFPPAVVTDSTGKPAWSWRVAILPYLGEKELFEEFHHHEPWNSPHNLAVAKKMPKVFQSPGRPDDGKTSVLLFTGEAAAFNGDRTPALADIKDGAGYTILCVEAGADKAVFWTKPEDLPFDPANPLAALGQICPDGILAAFFDGHVQILPPDAKKLKALITPNGHEPVEL